MNTRRLTLTEVSTVYHSTVTEKGQITVPVAVRHALGMERGTRITFSVIGDELHAHVERQGDARG